MLGQLLTHPKNVTNVTSLGWVAEKVVIQDMAMEMDDKKLVVGTFMIFL